MCAELARQQPRVGGIDVIDDEVLQAGRRDLLPFEAPAFNGNEMAGSLAGARP